MLIRGKIVGKLIKDAGKGKDAEAHEVGVIVVKLDQVDGIRGRLELAVPVDALNDYDLGDVGEVSFDIRQTRLDLAGASR